MIDKLIRMLLLKTQLHCRLQVAKIAERVGFRALHGIVDSIWIRKKGGYNCDIKVECLCLKLWLWFETSLTKMESYSVFHNQTLLFPFLLW
jgi:hypothetical protein